MVGIVQVAEAKSPDRIKARRWDDQVLRQSEKGRDLLLREQVRTKELNRRWLAVHELLGGHQISRKSQTLLRSRGLGPALINGDSRTAGLKQATDFQDTLHILIVRISFESNRDSNLTTILPDGDFQLDPLSDPGPLEIDPPPHDKAYFEAHLQGLSEFYRFQSGGRLHIQGRVLPEGPRESYKVGDIADYGPGADNFWQLEGLERLVRDMMVVTDEGTQADQSINLADYDDDNPFYHIIFVHAGSDWQSDINGDSPNDIPTFFLQLGEPQSLIGTDSETGTPGLLSECSIIPETANTDGYPGSIAAAFYHEFGHALGLVDIYNTASQTPNAGIWDLMDSGTNLGVTLGTITDVGDTVFVIANGVLPPSLGAWNKWFLGWLELDEIKGQNREYRLPAVGVPRSQYNIYDGISGDFDERYAQALRAGVSPREWFLLENRWVPSGPSETPFLNLSFERDENTGVILYLAGERPQGFWSNSGLYDYFMPAGGVLVWHVNEDRIEQGLDDNTINIEGDGLRLIEADGIPDIGILDSYVLGWFGSVRDPFGGYDGLGVPSGYNDLYTDGPPSSRAVDRSWTGFFMTDVRPNTGNRTSVMRFGAGIEPLVEGYPWTMPQVSQLEPRGLSVESLTSVQLPDGRSILVFGSEPSLDQSSGSGPAHLFALNTSGFPVWGAIAGEPDGGFVTIDSPLAGPCVQIVHDDDKTGLVWTTTSGVVGLADLGDAPVDVWSQRVSDGFNEAGVVLAGEAFAPVIMAFSTTDSVVVLDLAGERLTDPVVVLAHGPVSGPVLVVPEAGFGHCLAPGRTGWYELEFQPDGGDLVVKYVEYPGRQAEGRVMGALVQDEEINHLWFFDDLGALGAWQDISGSWVPGDLLDLAEISVCEPAVADLDGDGHNDVIVAGSRRIHAYAVNGVSLRGWPVALNELFPLPDSTGISGPLVVADATGDGVNELFFQTTGGHLLGLDATGSLLPRFPFRWGGKGDVGFAVGPGALPGAGRILWMGIQGGYAGPPMERNLVNGRISGYQWDSPETSVGTSEWLGSRGGASRMGSQGAAVDLGASSPAAAEVDVAVLYPNPLGNDLLTVRFYNQDDQTAHFWIHNLEGELIYRTEIATVARSMNEKRLDMKDLASGLYVCRLEFSCTSGRTLRTMTLAVER